MFQTGSVGFSHVGPTSEHVRQKLPSVTAPVKQFQDDFKPGGRLSGVDLTPTSHHFVEMDRLLKKYVASLITNTANRFKASLPVLKAFAIFDTLATPSVTSLGINENDDDIKVLAKQFFSENQVEKNDNAYVNAEKLRAEWGKLKFDLTEWKADIPRKLKDGKSATTSTMWTIH